ncbi:glycoside hydrolase N-terminal domain-containing protein [Paenibacillus chondroitinus]|uniref:Glycoside hydrolase N-terminal domain-containing protein n=1 Tax=Paenibacillus chondroitinus TaxID=59842 RepID=A0ABU6D9Q6_9BACL|nr:MULTISPECIES: glycoside hydrolase N-terminal domain-containing protein [Paenibacillus]MCY9656825.1 glycoside hydrolase N-terminal domain-containing protein [Paenibacillus anseongense]MEB4794475.1 glycoside hydrolase N-terminal domain-containing protein [Paenibacillus chondroitinus]
MKKVGLISMLVSSLLVTSLISVGPSNQAHANVGSTPLPVQKTGNWDDLKINWTTPASGTDFNGAPVGNGYFGAKVSGGVATEILQLNDKTFHSGEPFNNTNPSRKTALDATRSLLAGADTATTVTYREEKLKLADTAAKGMWGSVQMSNFLPIGNIILDVPNTAGYTDYDRELHLDKAMVTTKYKVGNTTYTREVFASHPDRVMVIRMTNDAGLPMSMTAKMALPLQMNTHGTVSSSGNEIQMTGTAPYNENANAWANGRGMTFDARLRARTTGGTVTASGGNLNISGAAVIELLYADATSYKDPFTNPNPSQGGANPTPIVTSIMNTAFAKTYNQLLNAHQTDYRSLFRRLWTEVNGNSGASRPYTLTYQYARYVMIAASRANTFDRPLNQQGMWNYMWNPHSWGAHFFNENVEKTYALIETGNLSENGDPLWKYMKNLAVNGEKNAKADFGFDGWFVPHSSDVWAKSELSAGDNEWAIWPTGGMWLLFNMYDHYRFTQDKSFLRDTAFPLMIGSAEFALDLLVPNKDGYLVTSPSTSPEAKYVLSDGTKIAVSQGSTIDMTVIRELFENVLEAGSILEADSPADVDLLDRVRTALPKLLPYQIGNSGEIKEWNNDYANSQPSHRHASHLIGVGFLDQITKRSTPDLFNAAKVSLTMRGSGGYHPDSAYMWARLNDGDKAVPLADVYPTGVWVNEWQVRAAYYPELFVQSHTGEIELLPSLPSAWTSGEITGVKARGGYELSIKWANGQLVSAQIDSPNGTVPVVRYGNQYLNPFTDSRITFVRGNSQSAFNQIEAENYDRQSGVQLESASDKGTGYDLTSIDNNDYTVYNNVDFGSGAASFSARVASNGPGGTIEFRLGSVAGTLAGTCTVPSTGGWQIWQTVSCGVTGATGVQTVYLVYKGASGPLFHLNWFQFSQSAMVGGVYKLIHAGSGNLAMDVKGNATANGTAVIVSPDNGAAGEQWNISDNGDGTFRLLGSPSGKALNVFGGLTADNSKTVIWPYSGTRNERWQFTANTDGTYTLIGVQSSKPLDVFLSGTEYTVVIKTANSAASQKWRLVKLQ